MPKYPFTFEDYRICIHCGSHNVEAIDKFDKPTKNFIYPLSKMKCPDCNTEYYIKWITNREGNLVPTCCGESDVEEISKSIIDFSQQSRRKLV